MKALIVTKGKGIEYVDVAEPSAGEGEVLVKLKAASINKRDYWISIGKYPGIKDGVTLGSDGAGIVDQVGTGVDESLIGKSIIINPNINWGSDPAVQGDDYNILGMPSNGTFAQYVVVNADRIIPIPDHLDYSTAAALPLAALTAFRACFHHGQLLADEKVLITGFGGGVAHIAFMMAKSVFSEVYVTSGNKESLAIAKGLGAKAGFNYMEPAWLQQATSCAQGFDLIIDSAGGDQLNDLIKILNPGGRIVFYGASNGLPANLDLFRLFWKQGRIQGSTMGSDIEFKQMVDFVSEHEIEPIIAKKYPFEHILEAIEQMGQSNPVGKSVIIF